MPSHGRWRRSKIVEPVEPEREEELIGGLRNAVERGETLRDAMQSFISAGYDPAEITGAAQRVNATTTQIGKQSIGMQGAQPIPAGTQIPATETSPLPTIPKQEGKSSKKLIIILSVVAVLILAGAAALGIFWERIL